MGIDTENCKFRKIVALNKISVNSGNLAAFTVQFPNGAKSQVPLFVVSRFENKIQAD
jgi:hypothetical protein